MLSSKMLKKIASVIESSEESKKEIDIYFGSCLNELIAPLSYKLYKRFRGCRIIEVNKINMEHPSHIAKECRILGEFPLPDSGIPVLIEISVTNQSKIDIKVLKDRDFMRFLRDPIWYL